MVGLEGLSRGNEFQIKDEPFINLIELNLGR
jgi:hypothetical protein